LIDVMGDDQIRNLSDAWLHAGGNIIAVVIQLYNWYSRYEHGNAAIIPTGLILSLVVVLILLFTGWKGWEMVYRYRVGVTEISSAEEKSAFPGSLGKAEGQHSAHVTAVLAIMLSSLLCLTAR
jgi:uncharacterized membrane protein